MDLGYHQGCLHSILLGTVFALAAILLLGLNHLLGSFLGSGII
jgi:hypothetical protein